MMKTALICASQLLLAVPPCADRVFEAGSIRSVALAPTTAISLLVGVLAGVTTLTSAGLESNWTVTEQSPHLGNVAPPSYSLTRKPVTR